MAHTKYTSREVPTSFTYNDRLVDSTGDVPMSRLPAKQFIFLVRQLCYGICIGCLPLDFAYRALSSDGDLDLKVERRHVIGDGGNIIGSLTVRFDLTHSSNNAYCTVKYLTLLLF